jgi:FtsP/CotA-like multicopper oxidase with cupredoxin domain
MEIEESTSEKEGEVQGAKPFVVPSIRVRPGDQVALLVAEVLNFELAQGSMPT